MGFNWPLKRDGRNQVQRFCIANVISAFLCACCPGDSKIAGRYVVFIFFNTNCFLQVEPLIIPRPIAINFLDWTAARSCCLLSWGIIHCGKLYSLHAQIEPGRGEILIAQYVWGNKQLICLEFPFITIVNWALPVGNSSVWRFNTHSVHIIGKQTQIVFGQCLQFFSFFRF